MKLYPFVEKAAPIIAAVLLLLSHSKNVAEQVENKGLPGIISVVK